MEIPEDTGTRFRLAMTQPIQVFNRGGMDDIPMMNAPLNTVCNFEWTGKIYSQTGHEYDGARVYQLVSIDK